MNNNYVSRIVLFAPLVLASTCCPSSNAWGQNSTDDSIDETGRQIVIAQSPVDSATEETPAEDLKIKSFNQSKVDVAKWPLKKMPATEKINTMTYGEDYDHINPLWSTKAVKIGETSDGRDVTFRYSRLSKETYITIGGKMIVSSQHADFHFPYQKEKESDKIYLRRIRKIKTLNFTARNKSYKLAFKSPTFEADLKKAFRPMSGFTPDGYTYCSKLVYSDDPDREYIRYNRLILKVETPNDKKDNELLLNYLISEYDYSSNSNTIKIDRVPHTLKELVENIQFFEMADYERSKPLPPDVFPQHTSEVAIKSIEYIPIWKDKDCITYKCYEVATYPEGGGYGSGEKMITISKKKNGVLTTEDILGTSTPSDWLIKEYEKAVDKYLTSNDYDTYFKDRETYYSSDGEHLINEAHFAKGNGVIYVSFPMEESTGIGEDGDIYVEIPIREKVF